MSVRLYGKIKVAYDGLGSSFMTSIWRGSLGVEKVGKLAFFQ